MIYAFRAIKSASMSVVCLLLFLVLLPLHLIAQELPTVEKTFEIAGETMSAGVELSDPKAILISGTQVWIADEGLRQIIVVDERTGRNYVFGRQGHGPGEFMAFAALTRLSGDQVAVLDRGSIRISILELKSQEIALVRTIPLKLMARSMCSISDRLFVTGYFNGRFLHEIDDSGQVIRSFGEPFRTEEAFRRLQQGVRSLLVGLEQTTASAPAIILASVEFGMIRAYGLDGTLLWEVSPPGFRPLEVSPTRYGGGIIIKTPSEGSYHWIVSAMALKERGLLIQVVEKSGEERLSEIINVMSYFISLQNGEVLSSSGDLPRIDTVQNEIAAGIVNTEYPAVHVYRITP